MILHTATTETEGWGITTAKNKSDGGVGIIAYPSQDLNQKSIE